KKMTLPPGFHAQLVAQEPDLVQPVAYTIDDRGRLWVIQYLQYPNPADLKRVKVDRYSRTIYDHVPEPPPRGPKGADRITILSDFDDNGHARKAKDFVSGLNLACGVAFGHGGVYVLQVPYLLFYPDRNGDDVPDSDPEVLLSGFGMEDASSVANHLTWGPDGWLYGCQGSCVTANIRGIEFQQGIWRFHPITHRFELFCEGGGNEWGMDFDKDGNLIFSSNYGGYRMMHGVQGGYYWKSFGKHGPLHNPHAYGYFDHVPYSNFTGGHVDDGGIIYQGTSFPESFRDKFIANDLLGHSVQWHNMTTWGTTFKASYGGELLTANDTWFDPTDLIMGPDGALYLSDWYDKRTAHPDPDADWDRSNGRVYRIQYTANGNGPEVNAGVPDMAKLSSAELVSFLGSRNHWYVEKARRILGDRRDPAVAPALREMALQTSNHPLALQGLWGLYVSGGFNESLAAKFLTHPNPVVRSWTVRLLGDDNKVSKKTSQLLSGLAKTETDAKVRSQLACTAKRLPAADALPIIHNILARDLDEQDPFIPLLLWWAVEQHSVSSMDQVLKFFATADAWNMTMTRHVIMEKLMRRYASEGSGPAYAACARLLAGAPDTWRPKMLAALDTGLQERPDSTLKPAGKMAAALEAQLDTLWHGSDKATDAKLIAVSARLGSVASRQLALSLAVKPGAEVETRVAMIRLAGELADAGCVPPLLKLIGGDAPASVKAAALETLKDFDSEQITPTLLQVYPMTKELQPKIRTVLLSRGNWALAFLKEVDRGHFAPADVGQEELRPLATYRNHEIDSIVAKYWGHVSAGTPEEKLNDIRRIKNDLRAAGGDAVRGRELFKQTCEVCHQLYGQGKNVGPDLTHANRQDLDFLLESIVDPSAVIRKEFLNYQVETTDGRSLAGLIVDQSPGSITLIAAGGERTEISRGKIKTMAESALSLMPEGLLSSMKPQELRDLFSYLQTSKPPAAPQHASIKQ
ncbi:MAG TPA: PVC-type heme-binding CxxCH protein, partial [Verrucomicrobiae bacterium]|nr:PVC-type heme-binding CxxCH protein [Verrucomicrobiae bacterium]